MSIGIARLESAFPETVIDNSFFGAGIQNTNNPMFLGTRHRRHLEPGRLAADLVAAAVNKLLDGGGIPERNVDILLTNVSAPDEAFNGCGLVVCKRTGLKPKHIFDLHNTGCVSFLYMLDLAARLMQSGDLKSALICSAQTAAGRIFSQESVRKKPQAAIPGDGCGVAYITRDGPSQVLSSVLENFSEYAEDMFITCDDGRKYWEPGLTEGYIDFDQARVARITIRGNRLVPQMVRKVCEKAGVRVQDISYLITNQPNLYFLRNWREALQLSENQHLHTFERYANLFGAAVPVALSENVTSGKIKTGDLVCLAGFSHAGDYAGATLIRW